VGKKYCAFRMLVASNKAGSSFTNLSTKLGFIRILLIRSSLGGGEFVPQVRPLARTKSSESVPDPGTPRSTLNALNCPDGHHAPRKKMGPRTNEPITQLLIRWSAGEEACLGELIPLVEQELRRIAHRQLRKERTDGTLQTSALVNEAYLKLVDQSRVTWQNRAQFLGVAAELMRRILVDRARSLCRAKRGGRAAHLPIDEALLFCRRKSAALVSLDDALQDLARLDARKARVVELRFFGGMSVEESAEALRVHPNTIIRDWNLAKAWLKRELSGEPGGEDAG
jgi:RNA polymerase sigma-70 factor, ECF subfamily